MRFDGPDRRGRPGGPPPPHMRGGGGGYGPPHGPPHGPPGFGGGPNHHSGPQGGPAGPPMPKLEVDREKTCPLLLRVFPRVGGHHKLDEYAKRGVLPDGEVQIYTWPDATLRELSDLIKEVKPEARHKGARLSFALVYPDRNGRNVMKQVGLVLSGRSTEDDHKHLQGVQFQTGDYLDVAVLL